MKKPFTILILLPMLWLGREALAQKESKSKKQEAYRSYKLKSSSTNVTQLLTEATEVKQSNPSVALDKVQEALAISVADGNNFNEAKCYLLIGEINEAIQEWHLARDNYLKAHQILYVRYPARPETTQVLSALGKVNLELKSFREALDYFQQAIGRTVGEEMAKLQLNESEAHYQMGHYAEANKALANIVVSKTFNEAFETLLDNQKAKIKARLNESSSSTISSKSIYSNSLNTLRSGKSVEPEAQQSLQETKEEIADAYRGQQRYDEEIALRNSSIEFNQEANNAAEVAKDKIEIGKTLEAKGEPTAALKEIEEAARLAETLNDPKEKANAFLALASLYDKQGQINKALRAYKKYSAAVAETERQNEHRFLDREALLNKQLDIDDLTSDVSVGKQEDTLHAATVFRQQLIIYGLTVILLILGVTSYFIYRSAQASQIANQLLALKSLRSQMNPHFIFNALNSVNHFIAHQDERTANKFLSEFSLLMRLVMENSEQDFITLHKEQEMLSLYLKLEQYRFRDKFDYEFEMGAGISSEAIELPPMLIQPYIENAVWHGLRYKETKGKLSVRFIKHEKDIEVEILDDGIGRKKSGELKTVNQRKHHSTGLKNISERLTLINRVYKSDYRMSIDDLNEAGGTRVRIHIPIMPMGTHR